MVTLKKAVLPAFASLALVLTVFACGDGGGSSSSGGDIGEVSSSSVIGEQSSSSVAQSVPSKDTFTDFRDGQTYEYVTIGDQTWMAENLNYNASGSKCYDNLTSNCDIYGRLYGWATAMAGAVGSSASPSDVQGVCPDGWHLPSYDEWITLENYVGSSAGTKLKSTSGWNSYPGIPIGTDDYSFSALPGGGGSFDGSFGNADAYGYWWSATGVNSEFAYSWALYNTQEFVYLTHRFINTYLSSVRCVRDYGPSEVPSSSSSSSSSVALPSSSSALQSSSSAYWNTTVSYGTLTDGRDGKAYRTVEIGSQVWMAENLNYNASGSKCYDNLTSNCDKYGRLYDWVTAMNISTTYNSTTWGGALPHQGICPAGWHLPSDAEWATLTDYVGGTSTAGTKLKAANGWSSGGNGTDDYGFSSLSGGFGNSDGSFGNAGYYGGYWWGATEYNSNYAYGRNMYYDSEGVYRSSNLKSYLYSARCVRDYSPSGVPSSSGSSSSVALPSSSSALQSSSSAYWNTTVSYGTLTDGRDGKAYRTVEIGTQTWMAENLNYNDNTSGSKCYDNLTANCNTYGRLYDWATAMGISTAYNSLTWGGALPRRGVCPAGWHIPSGAEWTVLTNYVGGSSTAGTKLEAANGWVRLSFSAPIGTDDYGFSALPGGSGFGGSGTNGYWWSATETYSNLARYLDMYYLGESVNGHSNGDKASLYSVRCLKD